MPIKLKYVGKTIHLWKKIFNIIYYYTNHSLNTALKKLAYKKNLRNRKILFKRDENNY